MRERALPVARAVAVREHEQLLRVAEGLDAAAPALPEALGLKIRPALHREFEAGERVLGASMGAATLSGRPGLRGVQSGE